MGGPNGAKLHATNGVASRHHMVKFRQKGRTKVGVARLIWGACSALITLATCSGRRTRFGLARLAGQESLELADKFVS